MLVQQLTLNRQSVVVPLLLNMDESPLPGTEPIVLYPRQHQHIVITIHDSDKFLYLHVYRDTFPVYLDSIVIKRPRCAIAALSYFNQIK